DKARELHVERPVEAQVGTKPGPVFLRCILADHEGHRVSSKVEQTEGDERDHCHHGEGLENAAKDEGEHRLRTHASCKRQSRATRVWRSCPKGPGPSMDAWDLCATASSRRSTPQLDDTPPARHQTAEAHAPRHDNVPPHTGSASEMHIRTAGLAATAGPP